MLMFSSLLFWIEVWLRWKIECKMRLWYVCICGGWNSVSFENKYGILYIELYSTFRTYLAFFQCMYALFNIWCTESGSNLALIFRQQVGYSGIVGRLKYFFSLIFSSISVPQHSVNVSKSTRLKLSLIARWQFDYFK